ncbi:hypothetical protein K2173_016691 [Erythroxylum novogranatense]|uniref:Reverse transcriptase domain-containing protein n=1 Tax=Erythroxylum novogranatense TaxID=1862640 RepID=A0AAV8SHJ5_9ROSI|nr:hypothetical protein K2173_016691 [Erythroxylum novogranatense]
MAANLQQFGYRSDTHTRGVHEGHFTDACPTLKYDPYSNTYNPGWRDHPNLRYGNGQQGQSSQQRQPQSQQQQQYPRPNYGDRISTLEDLMQNISAITLRSGKEFESAGGLQKLQHDHVETVEPKKEAETEEIVKANPERPPFPHRQTPRYCKFLKDVVTSMTKMRGNQRVVMSENVLAVLQGKLPIKEKDLGMFTIPCKIGNVGIERAMLDLGASINLMSLSIYTTLNAGPLKQDGVILTLADRTTRYPEGLLEDVLVQVDDLVFPVDFYVMRMEDKGSPASRMMLLGCPFLALLGQKLMFTGGTLTMEFDGAKVTFNINNTIKLPVDYCTAFVVDCNNPLTEKVLELCVDDFLQVAITDNITPAKLSEIETEWVVSRGMVHVVQDLQALQVASGMLQQPLKIDGNKLFPSILQPPTLELKALPLHLKYVFLGEAEILPVIVSNQLSDLEEVRLIHVLRENKEAIGWSIADIKGISLTICMHRILLEDDCKPKEQPLKSIESTNDEDSKWVSPTQVVPKKTGITVVENEKGELVPTRVQNGWRVCIDFRKLNVATRKYHFPLPFIDQMLEKLADRSHYCCLDGYSGFHQIHVAPEDQEKTTFTCPFGTFAYKRMPFGLCNAPAKFQRCMVSIFFDYVEEIIEVFMDDFTVYGDSFTSCLENSKKVLKRCIEKNLVLNYEKCHFMVNQGIILGHIVSARGIEVDKSKIDMISSLPYPANVREVRSFLGHAGFYR